mmetsp:Transcript_20901/g.62912  ORF Transcript_20901/g.62912 Transcript_20901/m.62912 type:complete len:298 (-) Transcript_20901:687-1580(-)
MGRSGSYTRAHRQYSAAASLSLSASLSSFTPTAAASAATICAALMAWVSSTGPDALLRAVMEAAERASQALAWSMRAARAAGSSPPSWAAPLASPSLSSLLSASTVRQAEGCQGLRAAWARSLQRCAASRGCRRSASAEASTSMLRQLFRSWLSMAAGSCPALCCAATAASWRLNSASVPACQVAKLVMSCDSSRSSAGWQGSAAASRARSASASSRGRRVFFTRATACSNSAFPLARGLRDAQIGQAYLRRFFAAAWDKPTHLRCSHSSHTSHETIALSAWYGCWHRQNSLDSSST